MPERLHPVSEEFYIPTLSMEYNANFLQWHTRLPCILDAGDMLRKLYFSRRKWRAYSLMSNSNTPNCNGKIQEVNITQRFAEHASITTIEVKFHV